MTLWCDGCRRMVSLERWATVFRCAPVFSRQGKRLGYVTTVQHSVCRTVVHVPTKRPVANAPKRSTISA